MEFFVLAKSNAAPFVSDTSTYYVDAEDVDAAVKIAHDQYNHPAGLFSLAIYDSADDHHKGVKPLRTWLCKRADVRQNGVDCIHCGGKTKLRVGNTGPKHTTDIHGCIVCGKETAIDMETFETSEVAA